MCKIAVASPPEGTVTRESPVKVTSITVVSPYPLLRDALRELIEKERDLRVAAVASDAAGATALLARHRSAVLLLDLAIGRAAIEIVTRAVTPRGRSRVVLLAMAAPRQLTREALEAGAGGCVKAEASGKDLLEALRSVAAGKTYRCPYCFATDEPPECIRLLTPREREVLNLAAAGRSNKEIARELGISHRTVEVHRAHLMRKLKLRTPADLVRFAIREGIVPLDPTAMALTGATTR